MSIEARFAIAVAIGFFVACTKPNPEFCKEMPNDPSCNPGAPDAAVDGAPDASPDALMCTTGAFEICQDTSTSLVCNAAGTAFVPMTCPNGCNSTFGCQICAPNQTTCANDNTQSCDSQGNVSSDELCTLGCSTDATRCKALVPSNNLGMFYTMTPNPQDLSLAGTLDLATGKLTSGGTTTTIASFSVVAPTGGAPIRVFVGKHVTIGDLSVTDSSGTQRGIGQAIAILATADIDVTGRVSVTTGAVDIANCTGTDAISGGNIMTHGSSGGSGGGHASAGGAGGSVPTLANGSAGGVVSGSATLVPLRGGCPGGRLSAEFNSNVAGGAIQLVSLTTITVTGTIVVDATTPTLGSLGAGGAGGGGVLIEAPIVTLNPSAKLLARGGAGASGSSLPSTPLDDAGAPQGATCNPVDIKCGAGGNGAAPMSPATAGADTGTPITSAQIQAYNAGGGGGGIGRIRINTKDANFTTSSSVVLAGDLTAGVVGSN